MSLTFVSQGGKNVEAGKELQVQSVAVTGGTLYVSTIREAGQNIAGVASSFVAAAATPATRRLRLTDAKSDAGVSLTASATSGAMGVARTAGTSLTLVGETTSSNAKTDKAMWEVVLPETYVAGAEIDFTVHANYTGGGTVTAASTTINMAAYAESAAGAETAITVTGGAQQITGSDAAYAFSISATNAAGASLVAGSRVVFELIMIVTTSAGGATGQVNSFVYTA